MTSDNIKQSFIVPFVKGAIGVVCLISPYQILTRLKWKHHELIPFWVVESYILIRMIIASLGFLLLRNPSSLAYNFLSVVCVFMLSDLLAGTAKIFFVEREDRRDPNDLYHFILVRDVSRWVILVFLNLAEIVLYFAVLYLKLGHGFEAPITDRLTAVYQSLLTFTTLGYGEIYPVIPAAKLLVMFHLVYFIIFVLMVASVVFSSVKVKEHTVEELGENEGEKQITQQPASNDSSRAAHGH